MIPHLPVTQTPETLARGGLVGAWWLGTMPWNRSNLTPVCVSIRVFKHKSEHGVERLWHWLHGKPLILYWNTRRQETNCSDERHSAKSRSNRSSDPKTTCSPSLPGRWDIYLKPASTRPDHLLSLWPMKKENDLSSLPPQQGRVSCWA